MVYTKALTKLIIIGSIAVIMIIMTLVGALSYSIDNDDEYYVKAGDVVDGVFIIEDYVPGTVLKSNMEWVSLDKDKYVSEKIGNGIKLVEENYVFYYWITIPEDADVGIYRGTIEIRSGGQVKYLNIMISVQNEVVNGVSSVFRNPNMRIPLISIGIFFLMIMFFIAYMRARSSNRGMQQ